ncbi:hypothetical protein [Natranaeroarchaeum aerophilus]|uniref:Uncharacterized protein n=1 Tax=Natranaeroarchaeum aerophilus TaxID=2917711 RepID=A0AAE3FPR1_9EURY|nr:hypothetical protein [Natranaeroarchaeum aerophilus]MCL9812820.1 hypothetical protein [Natranaeroarchaeum aerophilus]
MDPFTIAGVSGVLLLTLCLGTVVHEYTHALALRAFGIEYRIDWLGGRKGIGRLRAGVLGTWASVTPQLSAETPVGGLRVAALMPLTLTIPFILVAIGALSDPLATGSPYVIAAAVAWLACALPSPQDFSTVWYAHRLVDEEASANDGSH